MPLPQHKLVAVRKGISMNINRTTVRIKNLTEVDFFKLHKQPSYLPGQDYSSLQQTVMIYLLVWHLHLLYVGGQHFGKLPYATCIMILKPKSSFSAQK